jgi:hypothetical protein
MALECFKILYKLSPPCLNDLAVLQNSKYSLDSANFNQFKNILLSWNGNECKCNACTKI